MQMGVVAAAQESVVFTQGCAGPLIWQKANLGLDSWDAP